MPKTRPTFLGIGAQKAGTSWLYKQLVKHPDIWMPPIKELHFFDRSPRYPSPNQLATSSPLARALGSKPWERPRMMAELRSVARPLKAGNFRRAAWRSKWTFGYYNEGWYNGLFAEGASYKACGEITPCYSMLDRSDVARIKAVNADARLIFMIRHPIARAWSAVRFDVHKGFSDVDLDSDDEVLASLKTPGNVLRGDYERTLDIYLDHFDASQILVCFYDAVRCDPVGLMSGIASFIGVSPFEEAAVDNEKRFNPSPSRRMSDRVEAYLLDAYTPMIERLADRFGSYATLWKGASGRYDVRSLEGHPAARLRPVVHP